MRLWECAAKHDRDNPAGVRLHPLAVLALARGIPRELVRKIVGHATLEMTGRYFNPTEKNAADLFARYTGGSLFGNGPKTALETRRAFCLSLLVRSARMAGIAEFSRISAVWRCCVN